MIADLVRTRKSGFLPARERVQSALSHAAPLVMPPCDTDFPDVDQRVASGLWAAIGLR